MSLIQIAKLEELVYEDVDKATQVADSESDLPTK